MGRIEGVGRVGRGGGGEGEGGEEREFVCR